METSGSYRTRMQIFQAVFQIAQARNTSGSPLRDRFLYLRAGEDVHRKFAQEFAQGPDG